MRSLKEIYDELCPQYIAVAPEKAHKFSLQKINDKFLGYTDKDGIHSYLSEIYTQLFDGKRQTAARVLEIGVWTGGSLVLWRDYFTKAYIYGIDTNQTILSLLEEERIIQINGDAYSDYVVNSFVNKKYLFDVIIDDGPHTIESMLLCIEKYLPLLTKDGVLVIEDLQNIVWAEILMSSIPNQYKKCTYVRDLRSVKGVYDDIALIVDLRKM